MSLFEQSPSRSGSRFGKLSSNMFFTRNTAKPKRVRHIEGLNGALICNVNDDPSVVRSNSASALALHRPTLSAFETPRRVERLIPPTGFWNTYGVIRDTDRWRQELALLASASGLGVEREDQKPRSPTHADRQLASRSGAKYSARTGRFNEGTPKTRGRTGSKHGTPYNDLLMSMPENEREMWMLQVLCQLLGTSNLEDIQSWLVSASPMEKEQARTMISSALHGLKESERTENSLEQPVDINSLTNFIERQRQEEKQASTRFMQDSLQRPPTVSNSMDTNQKSNLPLRQSWANLVNNNFPDSSSQNTSTYKRSYQNFNPRSYSSFDSTAAFDKQETIQEEEEGNSAVSENAPPNDNHQLRQSALVNNLRKQINKPATPLQRSMSSNQPRHQIESIQFNDDDEPNDYRRGEMNDNLNEEEPRETKLPPIKMKELPEQDDDSKTRKIRQLQHRLSRQEEEAKRQLDELQSKQSRLENALKLLTKQNSAQPKPRRSSQDMTNTSNAKYSPEKDSEPRRNQKQQNSPDNRLAKSNSGVWKPEPALLHRLQGN